MSLLRTIRDAFFPPCAPTLRNKRGGMAMIHGLTSPDTQHLNGRIVVTVRADSAGYWVIDPPQALVVIVPRVTVRGQLAQPGDYCEMVELADEHLRPIKNPGDEERDESEQWLPPVPARERETA